MVASALIKLRATELPPRARTALDAIPGATGKRVVLGCLTQRPELLPGLTNCWVAPSAAYGVYELSRDEVLVCNPTVAACPCGGARSVRDVRVKKGEGGGV